MNLKTTRLFYWKMRQAVDGHEDKITVADSGVGLVVNEINALQRFTMTQQLAAAMDVPCEVLCSPVQQIVSAQVYVNDAEVRALGERVSQQLKRSPGSTPQILAGAQIEVAPLLAAVEVRLDAIDSGCVGCGIREVRVLP